MSYPYSTRYDPPMPVVEVTLGASGDDLSIGPLTAIIDTGADITVVPREYLARLGSPVVAGGYLRSPWGERRRVRIYEVNLRVGEHSFYDMEAVGELDGHEVLLGRDVLNRLNLQLDGPRGVVVVR